MTVTEEVLNGLLTIKIVKQNNSAHEGLQDNRRRRERGSWGSKGVGEGFPIAKWIGRPDSQSHDHHEGNSRREKIKRQSRGGREGNVACRGHVKKAP